MVESHVDPESRRDFHYILWLHEVAPRNSQVDTKSQVWQTRPRLEMGFHMQSAPPDIHKGKPKMSQKAISALLKETMKAHGVFEKNSLHGVYDEEWPDWYAAYAIEHGLNSLLAQPVTVAELGKFLAESYQRYEQKYERRFRLFRPKWQAFTSEEIVALYGQA